MLAGLRHGTVGRGNHQDRAVHLGGTGDHVLDVVSVTGGVDVCVVTLLGLVLHVRDVDRDTTSLLFGSVVDLVEGRRLVQIGVLVMQHLGDSCSESGLAVVNVTDGPDVDVRLRPLELRLRHLCPPGLLLLLLTVLRQGRDLRTYSRKPNWVVRFAYSPVAFAMISFDTFAGTSAYESNTME
ncbi:Uncharacterised protein [Mycobacteroides abscessus subsp. abscessus]|nr:Uncharacterised protein [Mycobacteroides abscessus subsp. abscessus]